MFPRKEKEQIFNKKVNMFEFLWSKKKKPIPLEILLHPQYSNLTKEKLSAHENLNLDELGYDLKGVSLPEGIEIKGDFKVDGRYLTKLPANLTVHGDIISMYDTNPKELSPGLVVKGELDLSNTGVKELPPDLEANKLDLSFSKVQQIPNTIKVNTLEVSRTPLPDDFTLYNLEIHTISSYRLPNNLTVNNNLEINGLSRVTFGKNIKIGGDLIWLAMPGNFKIPSDMKIGGKIWVGGYGLELIKKNNPLLMYKIDAYKILRRGSRRR